MNNRASVLLDCRQHRPAVPCTPHKQHGVVCGACSHYDPVRHRILVVKLEAMGDVLRTTSCLPALRASLPNAHVTWVTSPAAAALLEHNPLVDRLLRLDGAHLEVLLTERFDLAVGPDADERAARLMALASAAEKRGFCMNAHGQVIPLNEAAGEWWLMGLDDVRKRRNRRTYGSWLLDVCELPGPVQPPTLSVRADAHHAAALRLRQAAQHDVRWIGFNTGAGARWAEKAWKVRHFVALAEAIIAHAPGTRIGLLGGPEQRALHSRLLATSDAFVDLGTEHDVEHFAALVARCEWLLTADSLGYHVACATGTPAVCVVGPTAPWELDTFGRNLVLHAARECIGCYRTTCPLPTTCMDELDAAGVWARIVEWWSRVGSVTSEATSMSRRSQHARRLPLFIPTRAPATESAACSLPSEKPA